MITSAANALVRLERLADAEKAAIFSRYHKVDRPYLGVPNPRLDEIAKTIVAAVPPEVALQIADELWQTNIFEARVTAAKIFWRPQLKRFAEIWTLIEVWKEDFDSWAIADAVAKGGARCLIADPGLLDILEANWTPHANMWVRRAALVFTLPFAKKGRDPSRMLGWAAGYVDDREWFIQKAIGWWLRELSKHDPARVRAFVDGHGERMAAFARREATKYLD
ncbi:MAG: DNA alkylation repair protein [Hyphomicrobiales bacterium]|nr:DNA alkylation repair protein [Hyphomicrobiales bacterium]